VNAAGQRENPELQLAILPAWEEAEAQSASKEGSRSCKECGERFALSSRTQVWCLRRCRRKAYSRSGLHAARARRWASLHHVKPSRYEIIGKFEIWTAYQECCAICARPIAVADIWMGHIKAVSDGGQHTRANMAPVHMECEKRWNEIAREMSQKQAATDASIGWWSQDRPLLSTKSS
jgi:5-methylcytosine-specific restriction endonuclease McrA